MEFKFYLFLLATVGYLLNISKDKVNYTLSYAVWIISNTGWMLISFHNNERELGSMFLVYNLFCIYAIFKNLIELSQ